MLREKSCGVVPFREEGGRILYLVISSAVTKREHWEFPKGGVEEGEREAETALRELREETGVIDVRLLPGFREPIRYIYRRPEGLVSKQVVYFIGKVGDPRVELRVEEAKDYRWANYDDAYRLLRHSNARILLERCHAFITGKPLPQRQQRRGPQAQGQPPGRRPQTGRAAADDRQNGPREGGAPTVAPAASGVAARPLSAPPEGERVAATEAGAGQAGAGQTTQVSHPGNARPESERRSSKRRRRRRRRGKPAKPG